MTNAGHILYIRPRRKSRLMDVVRCTRTLLKLYKVSSIPMRCGNFTELFMTHPTLMHRAAAIAKVGELPAERVGEMLMAAEAPQA